MSGDPLDFTLAVTPTSGTAAVAVTATVAGGGHTLAITDLSDVMDMSATFPGPENTPTSQVSVALDIGPGDDTLDLHFSLDWSQWGIFLGVPNLYTADGVLLGQFPHDITNNTPADNELTQRVVDYTVPAGVYTSGTRLVLTTKVGPYDPADWLIPPPIWEGEHVNLPASIWWLAFHPTDSSTSTFEFDWDDGSPIQRTRQRTLHHTYVAPGIYTVTCTLYRAEDNTKGRTHSVVVTATVPSTDPLSAPFPDVNAASGRVAGARTIFKPVMST